MLYSSKTVAFLLALIIAGSIAALLSVLPQVHAQAVVLIACVAFSVAFGLVYWALERLVYQQVRKVYKVIDRLNRREYKAVQKLVRIEDASGNPIRKLNMVILDLANSKQSEIDELRRLETYRREFLADISHELKTPLFAAQGFIHTLLDGAADDERVRERFLRKAANSLDGLGEMVQELLLLSQLETGVLRMKPEVFDMAELAREVIDQLEEKAGGRHQTLTLSRPERPLYVEADRSRMRHVLLNLVENAIKYGNDGGQIHLLLESEKDHVTTCVRDDGPGIPSEHQSRIFERFYRIEKSRSRDMGGIGLGLAIVKQILEAHGTRIRVHSEPGQGAQFSFQLKRQKTKRAQSDMAA